MSHYIISAVVLTLILTTGLWFIRWAVKRKRRDQARDQAREQVNHLLSVDPKDWACNRITIIREETVTLPTNQEDYIDWDGSHQ